MSNDSRIRQMVAASLLLDRLARKASPAPWTAPEPDAVVFAADGTLVAEAMEYPDEHAEFIAAIDPEVASLVATLLAEVSSDLGRRGVTARLKPHESTAIKMAGYLLEGNK